MEQRPIYGFMGEVEEPITRAFKDAQSVWRNTYRIGFTFDKTGADLPRHGGPWTYSNELRLDVPGVITWGMSQEELKAASNEVLKHGIFVRDVHLYSRDNVRHPLADAQRLAEELAQKGS
jgi:hypothetical protein